MENSFFEYRDKTGPDAESGSDSEIIDDSFSFTNLLKTPGKNRTAFVAESEESCSEEESNDEPKVKQQQQSKSDLAETHVLSSSEDDGSSRACKGSSSEESLKEVVDSSSEEEECSPEMLPKRRPPMIMKSKSPPSDASFIGRKKNKRMLLLDSDTDNSIIIEHNRQKKQTCLKDTPLRINGNSEMRKKLLNQSILDKSDDDMEQKEKTNEGIDESQITHDESASDSDDADVIKRKDGKYRRINKISSDLEESNGYIDKSGEIDNVDLTGEESDVYGNDIAENSEDDGPDEDELIMSRATRMSIMGIIPKGTESDESDFIESDEKSRASSAAEILTELPDVTTDTKTPLKPNPDLETSRISCSPFASPLHDITNEINHVDDSYEANKPIDAHLKGKTAPGKAKNKYDTDDVIIINDARTNDVKILSNDLNVTTNKRSLVKNLVLSNKENFIDDDVTIVESKPEIIALSSDDEDEPKSEKKSPSPRKPLRGEPSTSQSNPDGTLRKYLVPPSYPGQGVVYVKKHIRENELATLQGLKEDLLNVQYVLENMDLDTLPDGGVKLIERLSALERRVREQGDKVANMLVEPDMPTAEDISKDGFEKGRNAPTWEDLQKDSHAVEPRMFGKQAMATHMAERNLILERLRDLHESLASIPPETTHGVTPRALRTELMPHQLHALAWLRWRETQRPCGGILADDMGLGKTLTMISLVIGDKDSLNEDDDDGDEGRNYSRLPKGGTLVVCPASLMQQWSGEVSKHFSSHAASVCLHHGPARAHVAHRLATYDIVLTTYNILQRDNEKNGVLMKVLWRRIILDEAHIVRNHKSATSGAVSALKGRRRWCLTGTPVQNKDLDLFALLKFLRCTPFDELTMWKKWIDNKSLGGQQRLSTIMQCILLRRTKVQLQQKGQLACLPARDAVLNEVTLSKDEMNVYQKVLVFSKTLFAQFLHQRAEKQADGSSVALPNKQTAYDAMHKKMIALQGAKPVKSHEILVLLLRLRQVCCHCGLIAAMLDEDTAGEVDDGGQDLLAELNKLSLEDDRRKSKNKEDEDTDAIEPESTTVTEAIRSVLSPNNPVFNLERQSSKIQAVMDCLKHKVFANKGDKAVVVSQWTSVLRLVERELSSCGVECVTLSGNVPVSQRQPLIDKLNDPRSNVKVMLLSLMAGGVGLNLCGANHLLLLDPHWNPQLEEQAQDRIYRVGQNKPVRIYRFMCVDTVEQSIRKLQEAKLELAANVLSGDKNIINSKLSIEDLKIVFNM